MTKTVNHRAVILEGCDRDGYSRLIRQRHPWLPEALHCVLPVLTVSH